MDNEYDSIIALIGRCCVDALLAEVTASPKPGLVDRFSQGAHKDMDFYTFLTSIAAISPYFTRFAEIGSQLERVDETTLSRVRPLGIECEKAMFKATGGINTHKGAIFSLGLIATAAGYCAVTMNDLSAETVCQVAGIIARESVKDFQQTDGSTDPTKGRELHAAHGIKGIRGEAASGFESVRRRALPVLRDLSRQGGHDQNDIHVQVLLHLMTQAEDTNVMARAGVEALASVRASAEHVLSLGGALTSQGREELHQMDEEYIRRNISPGGCADLLSVAIALYSLENLQTSHKEAGA